MKKFTGFIVFVVAFQFLVPFHLTAQSELIQQLEELKKQLKEITGEDESYSQQVSYEADSPYRIEVLIEETDKRGETTEKRAILNLGLLDKNLVRRDNSNDLMWVSAQSGGMPVIKVYENGEEEDYSDELVLYSKGVDNARAIEEILEKAIPLAEAAWEKSISLPDDLSDLRDWVAGHVTNVEAGEASFKQSVELNGQYPSRAALTIEEYDEKGLEKSVRYSWNFGDLHEPSIKIDIQGNTVIVEAETRQNKDFIRMEEDGEPQGFSNELVIYAEDVDQAQLLVQALREMVPLAKENSENALPKLASLASLEEGVQLLSQQIQSFTVNPEKFEQSLSASSAANYTRQVTGEKETNEEKFVFDFSDLNEQAISIEAEKQILAVRVPIKEGKSLVEVWENGEQQDYGDQVVFFVPDLPTAKKLRHVLKYVISSSPAEVAPEGFEWLSTALAGFNEEQLGMSQNVEKREGDKCKVSYSTVSADDKKVEEHKYEFNLYDIDPDDMALNVKGKTVEVILPTNHNEEIIKDYENGEDINYINEVSLMMPNIETAKKVKATFEKIVNDCSKE